MTRLYHWMRRIIRRRDPHGPLYLSGPGVDDAAGGWWVPYDDAPGDVPHVDPDHAAKISAANATRHVQTRGSERT